MSNYPRRNVVVISNHAEVGKNERFSQKNIDDGIRRMARARQNGDQADFNNGYQLLQSASEAIKDSDRATYDEYVHCLEDTGIRRSLEYGLTVRYK